MIYLSCIPKILTNAPCILVPFQNYQAFNQSWNFGNGKLLIGINQTVYVSYQTKLHFCFICHKPQDLGTFEDTCVPMECEFIYMVHMLLIHMHKVAWRMSSTEAGRINVKLIGEQGAVNGNIWLPNAFITMIKSPDCDIRTKQGSDRFPRSNCTNCPGSLTAGT